jgi:hypothetical protein
MIDFNLHQRDQLARICRFFYICQTFFIFLLLSTPIQSDSLLLTPISGSHWLVRPVAFPCWPPAPASNPYFKEQARERLIAPHYHV